ncbi:collagen-like triple helix repeat-containing protein [Ralstonia sp. UBA689]|uniref:collagen-like triple helix repeat-containing protein n=1 Tax=Ralstonia sp. UBA689 TaxID=1947373 RepID=UPI0025E5A91A|nr:collagen-like triple helix repeat-containing protein [Ralstonia sp. UBA689]
MRDRAFLLTLNPPKRGVFPQAPRAGRALCRMPCALAAASFALLAGCANSGSGDMGTSLGGGSNSQSKPAIAASSSPTWSNGSSDASDSANAGSTGGTPIATLTGPVEQVTTTAVTAIVPLTAMLTSTTQTLGSATGLGAPVGGVLTTLGSEGRTITTTAKGDALVSTLGNAVSALGAITGGLSAVVTPAAPSTGGSTPGGALAGALPGALGGALAPVTTAVGSLTAGIPGIGSLGGTATTSSPAGGLGSIGSTVGGVVGSVLSGVTPGAHR